MNIDKSLKLNCGIYVLVINDKFYIGSSKNLYKRLKQHLQQLKTNKHFNKHLQNLYNKYGLIEYKILEFCDEDIRLQREEFYISLFDNINNIKHPTENTKELLGKTVYKLDINKNIVHIYDRISNISKDLGIEANTISEGIRRKGVYRSGIFLYVEDLNHPNIEEYLSKIIIKTTVKGKIVEIYPSLDIANKKISGGKDSLRYYIKTKKVLDEKYLLIRANTLKINT